MEIILIFVVFSQEPSLFDETIAENIRHGKLKATQGEINEAARKTESWNFISAFPDGMRTRVGDRSSLFWCKFLAFFKHFRGVQLSGGQKQRIAISRAVIRNPSLLIFDEACYT